MNNFCSTAILGIGSPHGDDQFGWSVVDQLAARFLADVRLQKNGNPIDVLDELETHSHVVLVDAGAGLPDAVSWIRLRWNDAADRNLIDEIPSRSTHNLGLSSALRLAESLGKPTDHVTLWIGHGKSFEPMSDMSSAVMAAVNDCASAIAKELCDARSVGC